LVLVDLAENENSHAYFLCMAKSCEVAYYGNDGSLVALASDLKVPLWYKDGAEPRYACYCSRVTADQVRSAVREGGARTVAEVNAITGAMKDSDCLHNNPLGKCCHAIIKEVIEEALPNKLSP
jgi:bacterioferritin-associated ferredoxin